MSASVNPRSVLVAGAASASPQPLSHVSDARSDLCIPLPRVICACVCGSGTTAGNGRLSLTWRHGSQWRKGHLRKSMPTAAYEARRGPRGSSRLGARSALTMRSGSPRTDRVEDTGDGPLDISHGQSKNQAGRTVASPRCRWPLCGSYGARAGEAVGCHCAPSGITADGLTREALTNTQDNRDLAPGTISLSELASLKGPTAKAPHVTRQYQQRRRWSICHSISIGCGQWSLRVRCVCGVRTSVGGGWRRRFFSRRRVLVWGGGSGRWGWVRRGS